MASPGPPRWIADEMLGRLARYLRFLGHDTAYVRDLPDSAIAARAVGEGRILLTRDRALAARTPGALLLRSDGIAGQLRELFAASPGLPRELAFDRCPECNERLGALPAMAAGSTLPASERWPREFPPGDVPVFACPGCGRRYWDGSHARTIRAKVHDWLSDLPADP